MTYVIYDKGTGWFKIGKTTNLKRRFQTLSTSNLNLFVVLQLEHTTEKYLHWFYKSKRIEKEWFKLDLKDIEDMISLEHENNYNFS